MGVALDGHCEEWEYLRSQIYTRAMTLQNKLVFDFREMLTNAVIVEVAGRLMWRLIKSFEPKVIVGPGFGATPLLFSTALAALKDGVELEVLMVRDKRKDHNRKRWVEGRMQPKGTRAVVIDDFMLKGSALPVVEKGLAADKHELNIVGLALFFDMWQPLGSRQISLKKFPVLSLFKRHDVGLSRDCYDAAPPLMKGAHPPFLETRRWWRLALNHTNSYPHKCVPAIQNNAVFVADDQSNMWRHNAESGDIEWQYSSLAQPKKGIAQYLQHADNSLVFGCYDGTVTRLNDKDGGIMWRMRLDSSVHATPHLDLANQRFFVNTEQWNNGKPYGHLYACDWKTGHTLWRIAHAYWPPGSPVYSLVFEAKTGDCHPVVIATCNDLTIIGVNADDGSLRWQGTTHGLVRGKPVVEANRVYCATESGRLHCFDLLTGRQYWCVRYGAGARHAFPLILGDVLVLFDATWHLSAFDLQTGALRWLIRLRAPGVWGPILYGPYLVALSTNGQLAVIDTRSGLKVWEEYKDGVRGVFHQPPAVGHIQMPHTKQGILAVASNTSGLQVFNIHSYYTEQLHD